MLRSGRSRAHLLLSRSCCPKALGLASRDLGSSVDLAYSDFQPSSRENQRIPLVILHGLFGSKQNWQSLSKSIARDSNRRVIAIDARNHGESPHSDAHSYSLMSEDVAKLLFQLSLPRVHLLGHSMGGKTAMTLALTQAHYVKSLVVEDVAPASSPSCESFPLYIKAMQSVDLAKEYPTLGDARKAVMSALEKEIPSLSLRKFLVQSIIFDKAAGFRWAFNLTAIERNLENVCSWQDVGEPYSGPVMFVGGAQSPYLTDPLYVDQTKIKQLFPLASVEMIQGAGHWVHSEEPYKFKDLVVRYITMSD